MTGGGWEQRVKIVGWPLGGRWGNPDCKHSNLRDGEETQAQGVLSHTDRQGCLGWPLMDNGAPAVVIFCFYIYPPFCFVISTSTF